MNIPNFPQIIHVVEDDDGEYEDVGDPVEVQVEKPDRCSDGEIMAEYILSRIVKVDKSCMLKPVPLKECKKGSKR